MLTEKLIEFLSDAGSFSDFTHEVSVKQTHISVIAMLDEFVYKFKKPVNFGFLDFSNIHQRKYFLEEEVRLNQRLTHGVYLQVVPLYELPDGKLSFTLPEAYRSQAEDYVVDYALKMRRLSLANFLDELIKKPTFDWHKLGMVANKLASFYRKVPVKAHTSQWGTRENILVSIDENFEQIKPFIKNTIQPLEFRVIRAFQHYFLENNAALFQQRIDDGKILECHGDLKAEHVHIENQVVSIYDCIEFNERFRCIDILNDIAFLSMDLDFRHKYNLSNFFVEEITKQVEEGEFMDLLDFYKSYRAFVKGKVESLTSASSDIPAKIRHKCAEKARKYFKLSLKYALIGSQATLVVVYGGIATGKTTLAQKIAKHMGIQHFNSDFIRKQMAGIPTYERTKEEDLPWVYSKEMTEKVYDTLLERGIDCAFQEGTAILDATFRDLSKLEKLLDRVKEVQPLRIVFIEAVAPDEVIKERLRAREEEGNVSDARIEHFELLKQTHHQIANLLPNHLTLNTASNLQTTMVHLFVQMFEARLLD